jgi:hypothetical protein
LVVVAALRAELRAVARRSATLAQHDEYSEVLLARAQAARGEEEGDERRFQ